MVAHLESDPVKDTYSIKTHSMTRKGRRVRFRPATPTIGYNMGHYDSDYEYEEEKARDSRKKVIAEIDKKFSEIIDLLGKLDETRSLLYVADKLGEARYWLYK